MYIRGAQHVGVSLQAGPLLPLTRSLNGAHLWTTHWLALAHYSVPLPLTGSCKPISDMDFASASTLSWSARVCKQHTYLWTKSRHTLTHTALSKMSGKVQIPGPYLHMAAASSYHTELFAQKQAITPVWPISAVESMQHAHESHTYASQEGLFENTSLRKMVATVGSSQWYSKFSPFFRVPPNGRLMSDKRNSFNWRRLLSKWGSAWLLLCGEAFTICTLYLPVKPSISKKFLLNNQVLIPCYIWQAHASPLSGTQYRATVPPKCFMTTPRECAREHMACLWSWDKVCMFKNVTQNEISFIC